MIKSKVDATLTSERVKHLRSLPREGRDLFPTLEISSRPARDVRQLVEGWQFLVVPQAQWHGFLAVDWQDTPCRPALVLNRE